MPKDKGRAKAGDIGALLAGSFDAQLEQETKKLQEKIHAKKRREEEERQALEAAEAGEQRRRYEEEQHRLANAARADLAKAGAEQEAASTGGARSAPAATAARAAPAAGAVASGRQGHGLALGAIIGALVVAAGGAVFYFTVLASSGHALQAMERSGDALWNGAQFHARTVLAFHQGEENLARTRGELEEFQSSLGSSSEIVKRLEAEKRELEERLREAEQARDEALEAAQNGDDSRGNGGTRPPRTPRPPRGPAAPNVDMFTTP
jgi:chromosome segregation ATPase